MQRWPISLCCLLPCVRYSFAQSTFPRNISGIVTDSPEAVAPGASIHYKTIRRQR